MAARCELPLATRQFRNRLRHTLMVVGGATQGCDVPATYEAQTGRDWRDDATAAGLSIARGGVLRALAASLPGTFSFTRDKGSGVFAVRVSAIPTECPRMTQCKWGFACDLSHAPSGCSVGFGASAPATHPSATAPQPAPVRGSRSTWVQHTAPRGAHAVVASAAAMPAAHAEGKLARRLANRVRHTLQASGELVDGFMWMDNLDGEFYKLTGRSFKADAREARLPAASTRQIIATLSEAVGAPFECTQDGGYNFVSLRESAVPGRCTKNERGSCTWGWACDYSHVPSDGSRSRSSSGHDSRADDATSWRHDDEASPHTARGPTHRHNSWGERHDVDFRAPQPPPPPRPTATTVADIVAPGTTCRVPDCTYPHARHACFRCRDEDADHCPRDCPHAAACKAPALSSGAPASAAAPTSEPVVATGTAEHETKSGRRTTLPPCAPLPRDPRSPGRALRGSLRAHESRPTAPAPSFPVSFSPALLSVLKGLPDKGKLELLKAVAAKGALSGDQLEALFAALG